MFPIKNSTLHQSLPPCQLPSEPSTLPPSPARTNLAGTALSEQRGTARATWDCARPPAPQLQPKQRVWTHCSLVLSDELSHTDHLLPRSDCWTSNACTAQTHRHSVGTGLYWQLILPTQHRAPTPQPRGLSSTAPFSTAQVATLAKVEQDSPTWTRRYLTQRLRNQAEQGGWKFRSPAQGRPKEKSPAMTTLGQEKPD